MERPQTDPSLAGDETYNVPRCIGVAQDVNNIQGNYITYRSGSEASSSFQAEASLSVRYLAVSGSASASYATEKSFRQENQYAFYSFNADTYAASLRDYADLLNESALKRRIADLPVPFDGSNSDHVKQWRDFFSSFGTHVIINCSYGARFQLVSRRFSSHVPAHRITNGPVTSERLGLQLGELCQQSFLDQRTSVFQWCSRWR